jgi:hypothetical protein
VSIYRKQRSPLYVRLAVTLEKTHSCTITKINTPKCSDLTRICSENQIKLVNSFCGRISELLKITAGFKYS